MDADRGSSVFGHRDAEVSVCYDVEHELLKLSGNCHAWVTFEEVRSCKSVLIVSGNIIASVHPSLNLSLLITEAGIGHPVVEGKHALFPMLSVLIQQRPSSSCGGVLPFEQMQPLPRTLQQGVASVPAAAADAEADAETSAAVTGQSFAVGCTV